MKAGLHVLDFPLITVSLVVLDLKMQALNLASSFRSIGRHAGSRAVSLLAWVTAMCLLAGAAAGQSPVLTLDQAIDLALTHNHALKATRTLILQNQDQEVTANLRPNPSFGADSQF